MAHPSFPTTVWRLQPTREGKLKVADGRGGPFDLSWEVHGKGETKLVVSGHVPDIELSKRCWETNEERRVFCGDGGDA